MALRAIRGATCLTHDDVAEMNEAVVELVGELLARNAVDPNNVVSMIFTATPDLHCAFPATAARTMGLADVPLMCAQELDIEGALARVVRVMVHVDVDTPRSGIEHVFLRGAQVLREDLAK